MHTTQTLTKTKQLLERFLSETAVKLRLVSLSVGNNCSDQC